MSVKVIGILNIRSVDSINYDIYKNEQTNEIYYMVNNNKYLINLSAKYKKLTNFKIIISDALIYMDFLKEIHEPEFPKFYLINNEKVLNDSENNIQIPNLIELYSYKSIFNNVKSK